MNNLLRINRIVYKELLELWRKAGIVALVLSLPILEVLVLGYAVAGDIAQLPAAVVDADQTAASRRLISDIAQSEAFEVVQVDTDSAPARRLLDNGKVNAVFVIPQGFELALTAHPPADIAATVDGSNMVLALPALVYARQVIAHFTQQQLAQTDYHPPAGPLSVQTRVWYNQNFRRADFYIPGLIGTMLALVVLALTAISIVREREGGTLEQLLVSPTRPFELIIGKLIPIVFIAYAELAIMLLMATRIFGIVIRGSLGLYLGLMFIYLLAEMGVGIFISTISRNQAQALPTIFLLVTTDGIMAGFITPVETMPPAMQQIAQFVPLKHFVTITRDLFSKGADLSTLYPHLIPLVAIALILFVVSAVLLQKQLV